MIMRPANPRPFPQDGCVWFPATTADLFRRLVAVETLDSDA